MAQKLKRPFDPKLFLATMNGGRRLVKYPKNTVIFSQGDPANELCYVRDGKIKIVATSKQGKEAVVAVIGVDEFFGEGCLVNQPVRLATARAIIDCEVMRIDKKEVIRILHDEPAFSDMFVSHLLTRNTRVEADLVDQLFNSSEKRLARTLLLLANFGKESTPEAVIPQVSQKTLADMVGTTRPRINSFMNKFRKLGFIEYNGHLKVNAALMNVILND